MIPPDTGAALRAYLLADTRIAEEVEQKIYAIGAFTEYDPPCIVFGLQGGEINRTLDGDEDEQNPEIQVDIYSKDYEQANRLREYLHDRLSTANHDEAADHVILSCAVDPPRDDDEPLLLGQTIPDFVFTLTARPWLRRA
jgi:hypothetical protein